MIYVFDCSPLVVLFRHYYPERFPSLWEKFSAIIDAGQVTSVREVANEIDSYAQVDRLTEWANESKPFFPKPSVAELGFIVEIFRVKHFHELIRKKERLAGKPVADPFVIARACIAGGCVVTQESRKNNAAKIPNVCDHFGISCINLEEFMERENWIF